MLGPSNLTQPTRDENRFIKESKMHVEGWDELGLYCHWMRGCNAHDWTSDGRSDGERRVPNDCEYGTHMLSQRKDTSDTSEHVGRLVTTLEKLGDKLDAMIEVYEKPKAAPYRENKKPPLKTPKLGGYTWNSP